MAQKSKFFKSINGDRLYTANQFVEYLATFFSTGVLKPEDLVVSAASGRAVAVSAGVAIINGYSYESDALETLTLAANSSGSPRIDRVVLRLNANDNARNILLAIVEGSTTAAALETDFAATGIYEISLAQITVASGATQIVQGDILDERLDTAVCGLVYVNANIDNSKSYAKVSTAYEMTNADDYVIATSGSFPITLPPAATANNKHYTIKNVGSGSISLSGDSSETIDSGSSITLDQFDAVEVFTDGIEWFVV
jgi:hypothetical protein